MDGRTRAIGTDAGSVDDPLGRIAGGRQAIEDGEVFPPIDSSPLRWRRPVLDLPFEIGQEALEPRVLVPVWVNDVKRGIDLVEAREEHR